MASLTISIAVTFLSIFLIKCCLNYLKELKFSWDYSTASIPLPFIGHAYLVAFTKRENMLAKLISLFKGHSKRTGSVIAGQKSIIYYHPDPVEEILSSNEIISKPQEYIYAEVS